MNVHVAKLPETDGWYPASPPRHLAWASHSATPNSETDGWHPKPFSAAPISALGYSQTTTLWHPTNPSRRLVARQPPQHGRLGPIRGIPKLAHRTSSWHDCPHRSWLRMAPRKLYSQRHQVERQSPEVQFAKIQKFQNKKNTNIHQKMPKTQKRSKTQQDSTKRHKKRNDI